MDKYDEKADALVGGSRSEMYAVVIAAALRQSAADATAAERQRILNTAFDAELIEGATFLGNEEDMSGQDMKNMMFVPAAALDPEAKP